MRDDTEDLPKIRDDEYDSNWNSEAKMESPWAKPRRTDEPKTRIVGWQNGASITKGEQERILKTDKYIRQTYLDDRKSLAQSKYKDMDEPLVGLPAVWQAFWSTVPNMDAQAAFRHHKRDIDRQEKKKKEAEADEVLAKMLAQEDEQDEIPDNIEEEVKRLEVECRKRKEVYQDRQRSQAEWERKLTRVRTLNRDEDEKARKFSRVMDKASYDHGVLQGKIRSSEIYFSYLYEDTKAIHGKKVNTLSRACNLMNKKINEMKGDLRQLLKVAAETLPAPPVEGSVTNPLGSNKATSDDEGLSDVDSIKPQMLG